LTVAERPLMTINARPVKGLSAGPVYGGKAGAKSTNVWQISRREGPRWRGTPKSGPPDHSGPHRHQIIRFSNRLRNFGGTRLIGLDQPPDCDPVHSGAD
jgi:hypothetical protein